MRIPCALVLVVAFVGCVSDPARVEFSITPDPPRPGEPAVARLDAPEGRVWWVGFGGGGVATATANIDLSLPEVSPTALISLRAAALSDQGWRMVAQRLIGPPEVMEETSVELDLPSSIDITKPLRLSMNVSKVPGARTYVALSYIAVSGRAANGDPLTTFRDGDTVSATVDFRRLMEDDFAKMRPGDPIVVEVVTVQNGRFAWSEAISRVS